MKERVFIVHGWGGSPEGNWFPWLVEELEKKGVEAEALTMPHPDEPTIEGWVGALVSSIPHPDNRTFFVGHSMGCQTILRYLELIKEIVGGAVFIAGFFDQLTNLETKEEKEIAKPWLETALDFEKIKKACPRVISILSDDDPYIPLEPSKKTFEENLGAQVLVLHHAGHINAEYGFTSLPLALHELLALIKPQPPKNHKAPGSVKKWG